ncbi:MAG: VOC family protein [Hyphomicrobiaceae bacterium]
MTVDQKAVVPALRYRDVSKAIEWLRKAFGFKPLSVVRDEDGHVLYAELAFGESVVFLGSADDTELDEIMVQPDEIEGSETQICSLVVENAEASYAVAQAANAEFLTHVQQDDRGRKSFTCRDPEGHIWHLSTYNPAPVTQPSPRTASAIPDAAVVSRKSSISARAAVIAAILAIGGGALGYAYSLSTPPTTGQEGAVRFAGLQQRLDRLSEEVTRERTAKAAAERQVTGIQRQLDSANKEHRAAKRSIQKSREELAGERTAKATAEQQVIDIRKQLARARKEYQTAALSIDEGRRELERERVARARAEQAAELATKKLSMAETKQATVEDGEDRLRNMREQLAEARAARKAAERTVADARNQVSLAKEGLKAAERASRQAEQQLTREREAKEAAEHALADARQKNAQAEKSSSATKLSLGEIREQMARQRAANKAAEQALGELRQQLSQAQEVNEASQLSIRESQQRLTRERTANERAERALAEARDELAKEQSARAEMGEAFSATRRQIVRLRKARETAEATVRDLKLKMAKKQDELDAVRQTTGKTAGSGSVQESSADTASNQLADEQDAIRNIELAIPTLKPATVKRRASRNKSVKRRVRKARGLRSRPRTKTAKRQSKKRKIAARRVAKPRPKDSEPRAATKSQVRHVQRELKRVGCFAGSANGQWNGASQRALSRYYRHTNRQPPRTLSARKAIAMLQSSRGKVCPKSAPAAVNYWTY